MKILFFTETLFCGGKERRLLELIRYLKDNTDYSMALVITEPAIHFDNVFNLGIPVKVIKRNFFKYDPIPFFRFYKYCRSFSPDVIHTWGGMTTFYALPSKLIRRISLISSMIADAPERPRFFSLYHLFFKTDILFSDVILSNSKAGLDAYKIRSPKARVIWNGVNLHRFRQDFDSKSERGTLGVTTRFMVVMVAAFTRFKDYDLFLDVAVATGKIRDDVTFVGVGDGPDWTKIRRRIEKENIKNVLLTGRRNDVERIIAASDIGILCTYSEGISNSIIEYMALGKPVISTDITGGSKELMIEGVTGYCVERNVEKTSSAINSLLNSEVLRISMGNNGKQRIISDFSIERMGNDFLKLYREVTQDKNGTSDRN